MDAPQWKAWLEHHAPTIGPGVSISSGALGKILDNIADELAIKDWSEAENRGEAYGLAQDERDDLAKEILRIMESAQQQLDRALITIAELTNDFTLMKKVERN